MRKQRGIGLLELMLSLAVIALLLVMATKYFGLTHRAESLNHAAKDASFLMASAQNWRSGRADYTSLSFDSLYEEGLTPNEITSDGGLPAWDNCSESKVTMMPTGNHNHLAKIVFSSISNALCLGLTNRLNDQAKDFIVDSNCRTDEGDCSASFSITIN